MSANNLHRNPIHLGLGATAEILPDFDGSGDWYMNYGMQTVADGVDGRLVSWHQFDGAWDVWEVHPHGTEIIICTGGTLELVQRIDDEEVITTLQPGEYAINAPGVWHSANDSGPCSAVFITAGKDTENHPRG